METGKAYILRTCSRDVTSRGDFTWPRGGEVSAPDWRATSECGNGLHGFLWGEGDGGLADWSLNAIWIVAEIDHWIDLGGKVKFPKANVVFAGSRAAATAKIIELGARGAVIGSTLTGGDYSTLTGGDRSTLTGGYGSTFTGGDGSTLICRWWDGERYRTAVGICEVGGVMPGIAYRVQNGKFEVAE